jgi:hypothetical protein
MQGVYQTSLQDASTLGSDMGVATLDESPTLMSMADTHECAVQGCVGRAVRRGWCGKHYQRWIKYGDPLAVRSRWDDHELVSSHQCSVDGCEALVLARELCSLHYQRWQAHGDPLIVLPSGRSRGSSENYFTLHNRVRADRGTPSYCEHCGTTDPEIPYDWAFNHTGSYSNVNDYIRLCRRCHVRFDRNGGD